DSGAEQILHLDPDQMRANSEKNVLSNVYEHLLSRDKDLKIGPALATSYKVAEDGVTWTFELRKGVIFHDGTPFNAAAVKATFDRWLDPQSTNLNRTNYLQVFDSLEIVDDYTVRIKTKGPQASLPALLSGWGTQILSPAAIKA